MSKEGKILSLTIPTYNRAGYLKRLLDSISRQAIEVSSYLEIIIIDNASTDNTVEVVNDFINKVPFAKFIKNDSNLGMDGNFKKCFESASAKYFWMLGDDDFLSEHALSNVISILNGYHSYDLIYVSSTINESALEEDFGYNEITSRDEFIKHVGIMFTFISGMICNRDRYFDLPDNNKAPMLEGSFLMHLYWQLPLLKHGGRFAIINNNIIYATPDNSGGYRLFRVFSKNLSMILDIFYKRKDYTSIRVRKSSMFFLMNFLNNSHKTRGFGEESYLPDCDYAFSDLNIYQYCFRFFYLYPVLLKFSQKLKPLIKKIMRK